MEVHIARFRSLLTQTQADLDQGIFDLARNAEERDFTTLETNARAIELLARDAAYQRAVIADLEAAKAGRGS